MATEAQIKANRENAKNGGRPKGSVSRENRIRLELRNQLMQKVADHFDDLYEAKIALAKGHFVQVTDPETNEIRVYKKSPDGKSIEWLLDQAIGKPTQHQTFEFEGEIDCSLSKRALELMVPFINDDHDKDDEENKRVDGGSRKAEGAGSGKGDVDQAKPDAEAQSADLR